MKLRPFVPVLAFLALAALPLQAAPETYELDTAHSSLAFKIKHLGISWVKGSFGAFEGSFVLDAENPAACSVTVTAQAASISTGNDGRDKHLRSPDFFDAEKFPTLSFKSTKVSKKADGVYEVTGDFTIHGVTKPVTFDFNLAGPAKGMKGETRAGGDTAFVIKRSDYGMDKMVGPIGDDVHLDLSFEAVKK
jgi:polyisoprenoid-binding protein YceI